MKGDVKLDMFKPERKNRGLPKACQILKSKGMCSNPSGFCDFPLGESGCLKDYENAGGSIHRLIDFSTMISVSRPAPGKPDRPLIFRRFW